MLVIEQLPKAGGKSFASSFEYEYKNRFKLIPKGDKFTFPNGLIATAGHRAYRRLLNNGIKEYDMKLLTVVRNPIDRVKSQFNSIQRVSIFRDINWYRINIKKFSLSDYYEKKLFPDFDNSMVRRFSNIDFNFGECNESIYNEAIVKLKKYYFIGVQEEFNKSLFLLHKKLNWNSLPVYTNFNITDRKFYNNADFNDDLIIKNNKWDIKLYKYCLKVFKKDCQEFISENDKVLFDQYNKVQKKLNNISKKNLRNRLIRETLKSLMDDLTYKIGK